MATNHTKNYELSQWEPGDAVLRTDFNDDNKKIDDALNTLSTTVAGHTTKLDSHDGKLARLGNCHIYSHIYSGDGRSSHSLSVPAYPLLVFVQRVGKPDYFMFIRNANSPAGSYGSAAITVYWSDQLVHFTMESNAINMLNENGAQYVEIALLNMGAYV